MTPITYLPDVEQFTHVSQQQEVSHGANGRYRVVLHGAQKSQGAPGTHHSIAILIEPKDGARGAVVCDELGWEFGCQPWPSPAQLALYQKILAMPWREFQTAVNHCDNKRFKL